MANPEKHTCNWCGRVLVGKELAFLLKIEMMADPSPPEITKEDLKKSWVDEIEALAKAMEGMDPREAEDEVYESYSFWLCGACRIRLHKRLKYPFFSAD